MFGSHLSIAGSMLNALSEAEALALDTVQVFTKNQRQWNVKPLDAAARDEWLTELKRLGWLTRTVAHNSYLVNLASPHDDAWEKSLTLQREEIERCESLSIPLLVSHPGAHLGSGEEAGAQRIADAYLRLFKETPGYSVTVCVENTVGSGTNLGGPFEHLADVRRRIIDGAEKARVDPDEAARRVAFCFDTCHAHGFGHDMTTEKAAKATLDSFDAICGEGTLRVVHTNDSKAPRGSRRDLHEHIGRGTMGLEGFRAVVNRPSLAAAPKIMETPKGEAPEADGGGPWDSINLSVLKGLMTKTSAARMSKVARTRAVRPTKKAGAARSKR
ncbi:MAG: deoxyribonuclease IV [Phycisphaerales bacterium]